MSNNEGWFEVEGEVVGFLTQLDEEVAGAKDDPYVVNVKRWRDVSWEANTWCHAIHGINPMFMVRSSALDHQITARGTAFDEELGAGLGDTIRFTTNREEVENTIMWC